LVIGEHELETQQVPDSGGDLRWSVPDGVLQPGFNRVMMRFAYTRSPSQDRENYHDFRILAAAVRWISWEKSP
jgi:hypothetical protein